MRRFWLLLLLAAMRPCALTAQFQSVRVQVIDRGQADGILIRTPNEEWIVIDAGTNRQQAEAMAEEWGVDEVALAVISHRHFDHHGGMDDILRRVKVARFVMNPSDCPHRSSDDRVRRAALESQVRIEAPKADTILVDGVRFTLLPMDPVADECPEHENNNSVVVRLDYGGFSMLFLGDAETEQREWLMEHHPKLLDVEVVKASHHGSRNGADGQVDGRTWLETVSPTDVIISAHRESVYGHPHDEAMDAYEAAVGSDRIFCTSYEGTIRIYGYDDGRRIVRTQFPYEGDCRFVGKGS